MAHDLHYFASEVGKIRTTAINREWIAPPEINAQIYFRSSQDPRDVDVEAWASALHYIETRHQVTLTISGGGYACFAIAATSELSDAARFVAAVEKDMGLQGQLDRIKTRVIEIWRYIRGNSNLELLVPKYRYSCVVATNHKQNSKFRVGDRVKLSSFSKSEDGELILGKLDLWVYDPRTTINHPGILKRAWRKLEAALPALQAEQVEYSDLLVISPADIHKIAAENQADSHRLSFNVFVHGYGTTFDTAVNTYGRFLNGVRYDQIKTTPILFCWPSLGKVLSYDTDKDTAEVSEVALTELLNLLSSKGAPAPTVDILAHSHGTKLTLRSLITPSATSPPGAHPALLKNLIFIAPDISEKFFIKRLIDVKQKIRFMTIYFSRADIALLLSGWKQTARVGNQLNSQIIEEIDFIDASLLNSELLGHSYHVGCSEMHQDIRSLLKGEPAQDRQLLRREKDKSPVWTLRPH